MGGSSSPVSAVKKAVKKVTAEKALKIFGGGALSEGIDKVTGLKTSAIFNPISTAAGEAGEQFVDKPKAAKEEAKRFEADVAAQQKATLAKIENRKAQEAAEKSAADTLLRGRAKQRRKARGSGRSSTLLTDTLGGVGGGAERKSLIGL